MGRKAEDCLYRHSARMVTDLRVLLYLHMKAPARTGIRRGHGRPDEGVEQCSDYGTAHYVVAVKSDANG